MVVLEPFAKRFPEVETRIIFTAPNQVFDLRELTGPCGNNEIDPVGERNPRHIYLLANNSITKELLANKIRNTRRVFCPGGKSLLLEKSVVSCDAGRESCPESFMQR